MWRMLKAHWIICTRSKKYYLANYLDFSRFLSFTGIVEARYASCEEENPPLKMIQ